MNRPSDSRTISARVAVIGAQSDEGARLREALVEFGVPGSKVDLYGTTQGELVLSEYDGEARMIQEPELGEISGHDVIFLCENGGLADRLESGAGADALVIDVLGCLRSRAPRVHVDLNPQAARGSTGCYAVPHPLALLLAELLHPLDRSLGLVEALAVILRPASDFGEQGVEELREQTVRLLSFAKLPMDTFGRQLAFNILPQGDVQPEQPALEHLIVEDVAELLGWGERRLAVRLLTAPIFHGHAVQLHFRLGREATRDEVREVLATCGFFERQAGDGPTTPLEVTGEVRTSVSQLTEDGLGAFWLWVVAGETASKGAQQAVRLVAHLGAFD
jgi:aspartate-semialdehyde dehydrogenase